MGRSNNTSALTRTPPMWQGAFLSPHHLIPAGGKLLLSDFPRPDSVLVTAAANNAGVTTLAVAALPTPKDWDGSSTIIPNGTVLNFGTTKFATVNDTNIQPGDTTITVLATPTALAGAETATYAGTKLYSVPSGTVVGRTYTEQAAGTRYGLAASGDEDVALVAFDITDINEWDGDVDLVRPNSGYVVKENYLPGWTGLTSAVKALVRARYVTQQGVA
jgi:hypothetical protein